MARNPHYPLGETLMLVDPLHLLIAPMALLLAALFGVAFLYDVQTFRRRKSKHETVYRCNGCHRIFTDEHRTPLARCPNCGEQTAPPR